MNSHQHVIMEIARERERQTAVEGWTAEHDDTHADGEMARAAASYLVNNYHRTEWKLAPIVVRIDARSAGDPTHQAVGYASVPKLWPWQGQWWKPKDRRRDLIRAAALIVAEIERLDRLAASGGRLPAGESPDA